MYQGWASWCWYASLCLSLCFSATTLERSMNGNHHHHHHWIWFLVIIMMMSILPIDCSEEQVVPGGFSAMQQNPALMQATFPTFPFWYFYLCLYFYLYLYKQICICIWCRQPFPLSHFDISIFIFLIRIIFSIWRWEMYWYWDWWVNDLFYSFLNLTTGTAFCIKFQVWFVLRSIFCSGS